VIAPDRETTTERICPYSPRSTAETPSANPKRSMTGGVGACAVHAAHSTNAISVRINWVLPVLRKEDLRQIPPTRSLAASQQQWR